MSDTRRTSRKAASSDVKSGGTSSKGPGRPAKSQSAESAPKDKQTRRKGKEPKSDKRVIDEIYAILFLALGIFFAISMQTVAAGKLGEVLSQVLKGLLGVIAYALPYCLIAYGVMVFMKKAAHINVRTLCLFIVLILTISTVNSARFLTEEVMQSIEFSFAFIKESYITGISLESAGATGMLIGYGLKSLMGTMGLYITCAAIVLICLLLLSNTPISKHLDDMKERRERKRLERIQEEDDEYDDEPGARDKTPEDHRRDEEEQLQYYYEQAEKEEFAAKVMRKKKIMEYMTDDDLFKEDQSSEERLKEVEKKFNAEVAKKEGLGSKLSDATRSFIFGRKAQPKQEETEAPPMGLGEEDEDTAYIEGVFVEEWTKDAKDIALEVEGVSVEDGDMSQTADESDDDIYTENNSQDNTRGYIQNEAELDDGTSAAIACSQTDGLSAYDRNDAAQGLGRSDTASRDIDAAAKKKKRYVLPPQGLLNRPATGQGKNSTDIKAKAALLERTLSDFGVNAKVLNVSKGPTVTRYEIEPGTGVKVSSIVRLSDDIALKLEARSIRMEAPIPGKAAVGIEIENEKVQPVMISEVLESQAFKKHPSRICFAVGKDIMGHAVVADLASMPHMLIAGSTGSGKSVCVNSIIASILYKATPEEVKLILVDPKVVELNVYNGIPHLLAPVVTDPGKAAAALYWAVKEMDERYMKFAGSGTRKLEDYNEKMKEAGEEELPQIVIVIDELADLMMTAAQAVEDHICRLAQKARAAGMHLIIATQRPSVDVITGLIKANVPSRIAFAVSSQIDSRTILDMAGAEKLVGKGDMLFNPLGVAKPLRVQGTFITDGEVEKIIEHVKAQVSEDTQEYSDELLKTIETIKVNVTNGDDSDDELLSEAIEFVVEAEQASVSMLQRKFRIGYNRAARLVDMMEERGIVGPADGSRPRSVRMTKDSYRRQSEQGEVDEDIY